MRSFRLRRNSIFCRAVTGILAFGFGANVFANPTGMTVSHGSAIVQQNGSQLTVTASQNAFLNWQSFNIVAGETTTFNQPSSTSIVWNRINGQSPSQIYGSLQANGIVVLLNSSGFYFGPNSFVSAAGLVVSTANCTPPNNSGGSWEFNGPPPLASIINYGRISVGQNGSAFLIADQIENHGTIEASGGTVGLAAGQTVLLSERPDGRGMSMQVTLPQGSVDNYGNLIADAGTIALNAKVINQEGLIQANSVRSQNGIIELVADDQLNLGANSQILASGDDSSPGSSGGNVTLQSQNNFSDVAGSKIILTGGAQGGNGGNVEISAPNVLSFNSSINANAQPGSMAGKLLLDPDYIILDSSGSGTVPANGSVLAGDDLGGTLDLNVNSAFANIAVSEVMLQAKDDITLADGTFWNLSDTIGANFGGVTSGHLTLEAGRNIIFGDNSEIFDANNWSVTLKAGVGDFTTGTVQPGIGSIYLGGFDGTAPQDFSGSIQMFSGMNSLPAIDMTAGEDILVGSGFVVTTGGGSINAHALAGNIDTGSDAEGYHFESAADSLDHAYDLSDGLGGISTTAGGDVNLTAGGNVTSILPANNGYIYDGNQVSPLNNDYTTAGSGAYGREAGQAGNVTIVAGGNVTGNYLVANGVGSIFAGVEMDANGDPVKDISGNYVLGASGNAGGTDQSNPSLALGLITGGWNVTAAQDIFLQEVRNPNGVFDVDGGAAFKHYFDYAPGDYVNLTAGNLVQLGASASALPRLDRINGTSVPIIYPSILNVMAGDGGVELGTSGSPNSLILFPSPQGSLTINSIGSLVGNLDPAQGTTPQIFNLIVSDSGSDQYLSSSSFGLKDHAATPVHLGSPTPISLNISGDMSLVLLGAPEAAQINIGGDMENSRFQGMNLSADDTTSINVTGSIINRSAFTSVTLDLSSSSGEQAPDLSLLSRAVNNTVGGASISAATLSTSFSYDPTTQLLNYQNIPDKSLASLLQLLQNLTVQRVDANGNLLWLDSAQTIPDTMTVSILNSETAQALQTRYDAINVLNGLPAGAISPSGAVGYTIGGGGKFDISAQSIDLGTTVGIQSVGVGLYRVGTSYPLASLVDQGADISVTTRGDLDMYSTSIASLNGGNIYVNAGGNINVGSPDFSVNASGARGIFSTSSGDVSVYTDQNININGSRIAAYDGGNVTVESFNGDINAGTGGLGSVVPTAYYVDPSTHQVYSISPTVYGSGILATTFGPRDASYPAPGAIVGNILVETPNGNVNANKGGVLQLAFNDPSSKSHKKNKHGSPPPTPPDSSHAVVEVLAGYELRDSMGQPVTAANIANGSPVAVSTARDIDASASGVIAQNAVLDASGDINGVIFSRGNVAISAVANVDVTVLAQGTVSASAGGDLSGTIIGVGGISASGGSIDASLLSNNSISGATTGQSGLAQGTAANATSTAASNDSNQTAANATTGDDAGDDDLKKKKKGITLAQKVGRVTVILPTKTN
jgi:filamentous hemagglutinin family protein